MGLTPILSIIGAVGTIITGLTAFIVQWRKSRTEEDTSWQGLLHNEVKRALKRIEELEALREQDRQLREQDRRRIERLEAALRQGGLPIPE